jgi:hypothetical protein
MELFRTWDGIQHDDEKFSRCIWQGYFISGQVNTIDLSYSIQYTLKAEVERQ